MAKFVLYQDSAEYWRWRLVANNGTKIASSGEAFASRQSAKRSAELVRDYAGNADIID